MHKGKSDRIIMRKSSTPQWKSWVSAFQSCLKKPWSGWFWTSPSGLLNFCMSVLNQHGVPGLPIRDSASQTNAIAKSQAAWQPLPGTQQVKSGRSINNQRNHSLNLHHWSCRHLKMIRIWSIRKRKKSGTWIFFMQLRSDSGQILTSILINSNGNIHHTRTSKNMRKSCRRFNMGIRK